MVIITNMKKQKILYTLIHSFLLGHMDIEIKTNVIVLLSKLKNGHSHVLSLPVHLICRPREIGLAWLRGLVCTNGTFTLFTISVAKQPNLSTPSLYALFIRISRGQRLIPSIFCAWPIFYVRTKVQLIGKLWKRIQNENPNPNFTFPKSKFCIFSNV